MKFDPGGILSSLTIDILIIRFYPSEISTTRIRARAQAFAGFVNWMCVCKLFQLCGNSSILCPANHPFRIVIVVQITPIAIQNINWRTFIIFACFCFSWVSNNGLSINTASH